MNDYEVLLMLEVELPEERAGEIKTSDALPDALAHSGNDEESRHDHMKHIDRLRAVSEKIDRLQESLPPSTDPRLVHYLDRKSYDKALEYLEAT